MLNNLLSGKIRLQLLTKLLLNPASRVYLRGLEKDLGVSSNTVRLELNKLHHIHLIEVEEEETKTNVKQYRVNTTHPLYSSLRGIILQYIGLDKIVEQIIHKLGNVEKVYLTGDLAQGKNSMFVDLALVGDIDKAYLYQLIEKVEPIINKKIRVGLFGSKEFDQQDQAAMGVMMDLLG